MCCDFKQGVREWQMEQLEQMGRGSKSKKSRKVPKEMASLIAVTVFI